MSEATQILERAAKGDQKATAELLPMVYEELGRLAAHKLAHELPNQTLQPTALVHEAWLRLVRSEPQSWDPVAAETHAEVAPNRRLLCRCLSLRSPRKAATSRVEMQSEGRHAVLVRFAPEAAEIARQARKHLRPTRLLGVEQCFYFSGITCASESSAAVTSTGRC